MSKLKQKFLCQAAALMGIKESKQPGDPKSKQAGWYKQPGKALVASPGAGPSINLCNGIHKSLDGA